MNRYEWRYLKTIEKGRKLEAYHELPISAPIHKKYSVISLVIAFVLICILKYTLQH